ncbi:MAG: hypothetical protein ABIH88_03370 [Patescibacteria group bacterium]|nr:hypothetical protein [Patescibacteria group bacterium]
MLTKNDLSQIRKVVKEEVGQETKKIVQEETPKIVREIVQEETPKIVKKIVQTELKPIKSDLLKIRKDINIIVSTFDREYLELRQRVGIIEKHLDLPAPSKY